MDSIETGHDSDGPTLQLTDSAGDLMDVWRNGSGRVSLVPSNDASSVWLDHEGAKALRDYLDAYLQEAPTCCTGEDTECCPEPAGPGYESVALEAHSAVYGDRQADYGHPREDFTRTAIIWTALLQHKLAEGAYIEAEDIGRCQIGVKLARDVHAPKRDNRVDMAGYAITLDRLETGQ